jgi:hypothetical protein
MFNDRLILPRSYRYPLTTQKLLRGTWIDMARFQEPRGVDMAERIQRHVEAVGGRVRLLRGDALIAEWSDGRLVEDWRESA